MPELEQLIAGIVGHIDHHARRRSVEERAELRPGQVGLLHVWRQIPERLVVRTDLFGLCLQVTRDHFHLIPLVHDDDGILWQMLEEGGGGRAGLAGRAIVGRRDAQLGEARRGSLGLDIEDADRLDLVAEQLDTARWPGRRIDIQDAAAPADLAGAVHQRAGLVAGLHPGGQERAHSDAVANFQGARRGAEVGRLIQLIHHRPQRRDHQTRPPGRN